MVAAAMGTSPDVNVPRALRVGLARVESVFGQPDGMNLGQRSEWAAGMLAVPVARRQTWPFPNAGLGGAVVEDGC